MTFWSRSSHAKPLPLRFDRRSTLAALLLWSGALPFQMPLSLRSSDEAGRKGTFLNDKGLLGMAMEKASDMRSLFVAA